jgi:hypothetical protein
VTLGQVVSEYFGFPLSTSFHQCSTLVFFYALHLTRRPIGQAWDPSKKQCSFGSRGAGGGGGSLIEKYCYFFSVCRGLISKRSDCLYQCDQRIRNASCAGYPLSPSMPGQKTGCQNCCKRASILTVPIDIRTVLRYFCNIPHHQQATAHNGRRMTSPSGSASGKCRRHV